MKTSFYLILIILSIGHSYALKNIESVIDSTKSNKAKISLSTNFTSTHMWRAMPAGTAPCIEPFVSCKIGKLNMSAWASYALDNSYKEIDIFATYSWKYLSLGIFDYYCPLQSSSLNRYSEYRTDKTQHLFEGQIVFSGADKLPLSLTTSCFFAGSDLDSNGKQRYSTYIELSYHFMLQQSFLLNLEIGLTPFKNSMYSDKPSVFNYGFSISKDIRITKKWSIPSKYKLIYNPEIDMLYFTVSFTLK